MPGPAAPIHRLIRSLPALALWLLASGCFREHAFPIRAYDYFAVARSEPHRSLSTRAWLAQTHAALKGLLPPSDAPPLITQDLTNERGSAIDVHGHFDQPREDLTRVLKNYRGLLHTAQSSGATEAIENPPPPWPGFRDVWIPIDPRLRLAARLGLAQRRGAPVQADCIVILAGLLGDNANLRTRFLAAALRKHGFHVLALELRGYGQTERFYPDVPYCFGAIETGDLLQVARWLQHKPYVRDTGLIGFCWGANHALLAAWADGRKPDDPDVAPALQERLREPYPAEHYRAGVIAFSPVLDFEVLRDQLDTPHSFWRNPVLYTIQQHVRARMIRKGYPSPSGVLRELIVRQLAASELNYPGVIRDGYRYLRFLPYKGRPAGGKLERCRMPVLIVHGANDPLMPAQTVADLMATVENPNVAAIVLPGGGHVGFAAYARSYFYSLVLNFFDPQQGAAAVRDRP